MASAGVLGIAVARRAARPRLDQPPVQTLETPSPVAREPAPQLIPAPPAPPPPAPPPPAPTPSAGDPFARRKAAPDASEPGFRPDVEGLRGVAIVLVLLFHGGLPVPGGFIGVDIFFVISGFLITGMLLREVGRTGTIALDRFYARRIRRLLPAAAVVLAVTLPLAYLVLAPLDRPQAMDDGVAAMLSASNIRFALADGDYFTAVSGPSPFLHFWSLSLEEQFYLLWPLLLLLMARGRRPRLRAGATLAVILVASLAASVVVTDASASWAFYSLPCRAWQFAAGGLLAVGAGLLARLPAVGLVMAGWLGAGVLVAGAFAIDGSLPYPGALAVAPTLAAALLIASGEHRRGPGRLLATAPLRFLGRISYSLYLWHWPILVLPAVAVGAALEPPVVLALSALAIVLAWASERFVERPFRHPLPKERGAARRSLAMGVVTMATVVALAASLDVTALGATSAPGLGPDFSVDDAVAAVDDLGPVTDADGRDPRPDAGPSEVTDLPASMAPVDASPSPVGSTSPEPLQSTGPASTATPAVSTATPVPSPPWTLSIPIDEPDGPVPLPRDVLPSLADARGDIERLFADACITGTSSTRPSTCVYGDRAGALTIALVGDSHASHWFPAFNVLARRHGWRLLPRVKVSCPFVDMPVKNLLIKREYTECETWRERVIEELNRERPDLVVVVSGYRAIVALRSADATPQRQGEAMAREVAKLEVPVAVMVDSPRAPFDIPGCLSRHRDDVRACAISRAQAFPAQFGFRERFAAETTGAALIDLVAAVCPATPCQVARDGYILYRDGHHLTATFVRSLAGALDAKLAPILEPTAAPVVSSSDPRGPTVR